MGRFLSSWRWLSRTCTQCPGHHLLDSFRIHHPNPIRRQIESPLFYEGWACYGEQLLDEFGYTKDPLHVRTGLKRRLWRILRAKLDIELHTGRTDSKRSAQGLVALGYSPDRALRQVKRFSLTPGYQLCYFQGKGAGERRNLLHNPLFARRDQGDAGPGRIQGGENMGWVSFPFRIRRLRVHVQQNGRHRAEVVPKKQKEPMFCYEKCEYIQGL
ncbi:MAG: DUF885 family protein [Deltaproteobacteria bacterium]|nr:DUF885 family protein [Deltaproteobacteria bacterium]